MDNYITIKFFLAYLYLTTEIYMRWCRKNDEKIIMYFCHFYLIIFPLASFPVSADIDPDDDNDSDVYDANGDGIISSDEEYTNLEEYFNNTNPNDPDTDDGGAWDGWEVHYGFDPKKLFG